MPITSNKFFKVDVSDDKLTALLSLNTGISAQSVAKSDIIGQVTELKIKLDQEGKARIAEFAQALAENIIPEPVVIARGTPPEHDKNGYIDKLYEKRAKESNSDNKSFYDQSHIITVEKNQEILRVVPPAAGKDGVDVFGQSIPRKLGREAQIKLGLNVEQKGAILVAAVAGKLDFSNNKVSVFPKLEIPGNVDFAIGNIDFSGEVLIGKNVLDLFKVKSSSTITVQGLVEGAEITAGQDIIAVGGIAGKEKGICSAGQNLKSKYITNAKITAGANITAHTEIVNCELNCGGTIIVENGPLVGGNAIAKGGIQVKQLGSEGGVKTLLDVGFDAELKQLCMQTAPEITLRRRKADKIKQTVEPLMRNIKYLNPEQKEKATELLYQAEEMESSVKEMIQKLRNKYEETLKTAVPEVLITNTIYNGVTIRFPRVQTTITEPLTGPLKIVPREIHGLWRVLAIACSTNSEHELKSGANADPFWETLHQILFADNSTPKQ